MIHLTSNCKTMNPVLKDEIEEMGKHLHRKFIVKYFGYLSPASKQAIKEYHVPKKNIVAYVD